MRTLAAFFMAVGMLTLAALAYAQFKAPDQRAKNGSVRGNAATVGTLQVGQGVPGTLAGIAGSGSLIGCQEGSGPSTGLALWDVLWCDASFHGFKVNMNNTGNQYLLPMSSLPSINGQSPTYNTTGAFVGWQGQQGTLSWQGTLGQYLTTARMPAIMANSGHFTNLIATAVLTGSCTTAPQFNVYDITAAGSGTPLSGVTTTVAAMVSQAQILTFAAGDQVAVGISSAGATCTAPIYAVTATYTQP